jgi:hypothetical protein
MEEGSGALAADRTAQQRVGPRLLSFKGPSSNP